MKSLEQIIIDDTLSKISWIGDNDDFHATLGFIWGRVFLQVEQMDKKRWWCALSLNGSQIWDNNEWQARTEKKAKKQVVNKLRMLLESRYENI